MSTALDSKLEDAILTLLADRAEGATICPSEAARRIGGEDGWRRLMEPTRAAAERLVTRGQIEVLQRGVVVNAANAKGAIRLRRVR